MFRVSLPFDPNMKQIHEAVQALESDIEFGGSSWILLKKLKKTEKIATKIYQEQYAYSNILK